MSTLAIAALLPLHIARVGAVRAWGADIDRSATLYHGFQIRSARRLTIGARTSVGDGAILDARGGLTLGSDVNLSTQVHIWTAQHAWDSPDFAYVSAPVNIGDHAWLSTRVTVLPGVSIGEGAVVAAGSVVTKDLAPYGLYGGVPARKLRQRAEPKTYRLAPAKRKAWWW
ncbi:DapH/DapD/GlmU-related protein [Curtobacterium sp. MCLR17_034]|uniref:acyltransferase n=1 Tax=Curtobacterium sp. MCLR17_034 TaxID=2175623 RepID=UPI0015E88292|nr:acyltransferase [Curtobacterium sp. MCLR17_034]